MSRDDEEGVFGAVQWCARVKEAERGGQNGRLLLN